MLKQKKLSSTTNFILSIIFVLDLPMICVNKIRASSSLVSFENINSHALFFTVLEQRKEKNKRENKIAHEWFCYRDFANHIPHSIKISLNYEKNQNKSINSITCILKCCSQKTKIQQFIYYKQ